jgi:hypothetical protein
MVADRGRQQSYSDPKGGRRGVVGAPTGRPLPDGKRAGDQPLNRAKYPSTSAPPTGKLRPSSGTLHPASKAPNGVSYQSDGITWT